MKFFVLFAMSLDDIFEEEVEDFHCGILTIYCWPCTNTHRRPDVRVSGLQVLIISIWTFILIRQRTRTLVGTVYRMIRSRLVWAFDHTSTITIPYNTTILYHNGYALSARIENIKVEGLSLYNSRNTNTPCTLCCMTNLFVVHVHCTAFMLKSKILSRPKVQN